MKIAVVAMGKIGLPLAVQFAEKGHDVIGVDVQQRVVDEINKGNEPFPGEAHLAEKLAALRGRHMALAADKRAGAQKAELAAAAAPAARRSRRRRRSRVRHSSRIIRLRTDPCRAPWSNDVSGSILRGTETRKNMQAWTIGAPTTAVSKLRPTR